MSEQRYRLDDQIGFLLRKANQRHIAIFGKHISDLTPPQFAALAKLSQVGDTSQNQLGVLVAMDAATIKGVIDRLHDRGFVALARDGEDRRRLIVGLTDQGREAIRSLTPVALNITEETAAPLSQREHETLMKLLAKIS